MKSHEYNFRSGEVMRLIARPLIALLVFAALIQAGVRLQLFPPPRPTLDVDRTILIHQAEASRRKHNFEVLLLGDSSCLMDVNARQLSTEMKRPVLNLGTLSYLGPWEYSELLNQYASKNPGQTRLVVLLMNPEALRR